MGSKMVLDRQKSSATVVAAGTGYLDKMVTGMGEMYGEEAAKAARVLIDAAVQKLERDTMAMVEADAAHLNETADDSAVIAKRDEDADAVRGLLMEIRESADTVYGSDFVRRLGFIGATPSDPTAIGTVGGQVLANLDTAAASPPDPKRIGLTMDLGAFKTPLADALTPLKASLETAVTDKRKSDQTLVQKQRAMELYDATFSSTANLLSHLLRAAGEAELAGRVRPSTRKPGQTVDDARDDVPSTEISL